MHFYLNSIPQRFQDDPKSQIRLLWLVWEHRGRGKAISIEPRWVSGARCQINRSVLQPISEVTTMPGISLAQGTEPSIISATVREVRLNYEYFWWVLSRERDRCTCRSPPGLLRNTVSELTSQILRQETMLGPKSYLKVNTDSTTGRHIHASGTNVQHNSDSLRWDCCYIK